MEVTRIKPIILKCLQKGGRKTTMANKWAKFTAKYSQTRRRNATCKILQVSLSIHNIKYKIRRNIKNQPIVVKHKMRTAFSKIAPHGRHYRKAMSYYKNKFSFSYYLKN